MSHVALICHVDPAREDDRKRLRADHLAYIVAHRELILFGGPTLTDDGAPETMIIVIEAESVDEARAFIASEPYTANGVFARVDIRRWAKVLPEASVGDLQRALEQEQKSKRDNDCE